jgi:site-specific recombinase XerD
MATRLFTVSCSRPRRCNGPLGPYIGAYAALLQQEGYSHEGARNQLLLIADLSKWLQRRRLAAADVNAQSVERYLGDCARHRRPERGNRSALRKLVDLLHHQGIGCEMLPREPQSAQERVEEAFKRYLTQERGLSPATLLNYLPFVHALLSERFRSGLIQLDRLDAADIVGFVRRHAHELSPGRAKLMTTALRSFLRYLLHGGEIDTDLAACVPCVPRWSLSDVPKFLAPGQVQKVLEQCDRQTASGMRDYAILLLLARLGLRACEVVSLNLDDIDWHEGRLFLRGKGRRWAQLPLLQEVGEALAGYLQRARPRCAGRRVFVRARAPRQGFANSSAICCVVERALTRAGIDSPRKGAHLFRHTLATDMLRQGASLTEIGQLLRHRHPSTTMIYAKVDLGALRLLALPWPGGGR